METRPYHPSEAEEPPETPPPIEAYPRPPIIPQYETVSDDEGADIERQVSPDKLAWEASHRKEFTDEERTVERHAREAMDAANRNEAIEAQYEQRAEKRGDDRTNTQDEPERAFSVGEVARKQAEEYAEQPESQASVTPPQVPGYDHQTQPPIQPAEDEPEGDDAQQDESPLSDLLKREAFSVYRKYIIIGFFFGVVVLISMLIIWLVIG